VSSIPGQRTETVSVFAETMDYGRFYSLQQGLIDMIGRAIGDPQKVEVLSRRLDVLHEAHPDHYEQAMMERRQKLQEA